MLNTCRVKSTTRIRTLIAVLVLPLTACADAGNDSEGRQLPTDKQVVADVTPADTENVVAVDVVKDRSGEAYLHTSDLVWYFDRGVVVKRKADISGAPDAVVVVGGLARYILAGDRYEFRKFLTTYNEYEGIPAPSENDLADYVRANVSNVFVSREHQIVDVQSIEIAADKSWTWHSASSFSVPFEIHYKQIKSNTEVEAREDIFDIRFYRDSVSDPIKGLMATEVSRKQLAVQQHSSDAIRAMKTLRSGLM